MATIKKEAEERGYSVVATSGGFLVCHTLEDGGKVFRGEQDLWGGAKDSFLPFTLEDFAWLTVPRKEKIYLICPVRNITDEQKREIDEYVAYQERLGNEVHYPPRDVDQTDATGWNICAQHRQAMKGCTRTDVFWDSQSSGSHFDLGMAFMMEEMPVKIVKAYRPDNEGKSFLKMMKMWCGEIGDDGEE
jgi:hypothetical protein